MKLKYYLRGLGIGILITTIIFIIGIQVNQDKMFSDEKVIRRAKALGMVMDDSDTKTIDELNKDKQEEQDNKNQKESKENDNNDKKEDKESKNKENLTEDDTTKADKQAVESKDSEVETATNQKIEQVEISILPGEYSDTISQKLLDAGLIDDKAAFSKYINDTNVDNLIQPGTFAVPKGASYEEVAKILTTKQENR